MIEEARIIYENHKSVINAWEKSENALNRALAASIKIAAGIEVSANA